jgi:hypothetical protein
LIADCAHYAIKEIYDYHAYSEQDSEEFAANKLANDLALRYNEAQINEMDFVESEVRASAIEIRKGYEAEGLCPPMGRYRDERPSVRLVR